MKETQPSCFSRVNAYLPGLVLSDWLWGKGSFPLSSEPLRKMGMEGNSEAAQIPSGRWEAEHQGARMWPGRAQCTVDRPWAGCDGEGGCLALTALVCGWREGWKSFLHSRGYCSSSFMLWSVKESLSMSSGSASWCMIFQQLVFPHRCSGSQNSAFVAIARRLSSDSKDSLFFLTEVQIKNKESPPLTSVVVSYPGKIYALGKKCALDGMPWGAAFRTGATETWQREKECREDVERAVSVFIGWEE